MKNPIINCLDECSSHLRSYVYVNFFFLVKQFAIMNFNIDFELPNCRDIRKLARQTRVWFSDSLPINPDVS